MNNDLSPSFEHHRNWIEQVLDTPTQSKQHDFTASLTPPRSPSEHVLRGSKSFAARSFRSRVSGNSLRVPSSNKENRSTNETEDTSSSSSLHPPLPSGPVLGEIAPNGQIVRPIGPFKFRPSPTPSLKKKKAEAIVKAHGSPQHIRVTAGGRIVPSEQSPLCHPRYGYSAIKTNGGLIKFAPNHPVGKAQWTQATQNGFVAQDVNGRLCQIVNGTILPLNEVDGTLRLYVPAPNLNIQSQSRGSSFGPSTQGHLGSIGNQQRSLSQSTPAVPADPPIPAQTNALELEYSKLEYELKELDKTEVLHGRTMGKAAKEALVTKRRELVVMLDNIRKAIKSIRSAPPPDAPTSPKAMRAQQPTSPGRNRLPAFLQQRVQQGNDVAIPPMAGGFGQFFGVPQAQQFGGQYGFQPTPSPDVPLNHPYGMPPHTLFMPPTSFDGSMAPTFAAYPDAAPTGDAQGNKSNSAAAPQEAMPSDSHIPQADGTRSFADLQRVGSPRQSRALDIKAPEPKQATAVKSTLNPMSPAYKPGVGVLKVAGNGERPAPKSVKDRAPTPLSPLHQLHPSAAANKQSNATDETSPQKKSPHLHSSSVSSFETADFFPRNTREYSTRKYAYPDQSEDKENVSPLPPSPDRRDAGVTPVGSDQESVPGGCAGPAPPPGTPVTRDGSDAKPRLPIQITSIEHGHKLALANVPDRQTHNLSPKGRRQDFLFVQEHPSQYGSQASSSPERYQSCREDPPNPSSPTENLDFTNESSEWIEGYRAGLARKPVPSDRAGDFLDGYCAGLLKSKPVPNIGPSTGSPVKSASRRPSPAIVQSRSSTRLSNVDRQDHALTRPPFETSVQSFDTLKEAVFAPQNEDAILTPTADGPHVNEPHFNLGAWESRHELQTLTQDMTNARGEGLGGYPFPHRTASMLQRHGIASDNQSSGQEQGQNINPSGEGSTFSSVPGFQTMAPFAADRRSMNTSSTYNPGNRISSITSIDSNLYRQWPGHRVFSPHLEWKSASSVAQAAGLASGYLHNIQYDGASHHLRKHISRKTDLPLPPGAAQLQRQTSLTSNPAMETHSRFTEGSLDGLTNPPTSPQPLSPPMSPSLDPKGSPSKKKDSPGKGASPAKAKFEHIAEKVGIKVSAGGKKEEGSSEPSSPPGKRRWRDVWRGGARKEGGKDESAAFA